MPPTSHAEWLNKNSLRAYPFQENMQRRVTDPSGGVLAVQLANKFLVDFVITVALDDPEDPVRMYLSQIAYVGNLVTLVFTDSGGTQVATIAIDLNTHTTNQGYAFGGSGLAYSDARGRVVFGDLSDLADYLTPGIYNFAITETELEATTVRPDVHAVRSLRTSYRGAQSGLIFGHVKLLAGSNVQLTYIAEQNAIRVDAISGAGLNEECDCEEEEGECIQTINGIPINDAVIEGDEECVTVRTEGNRIIIEDSCSSPCCDCPELEFLTESLKTIQVSVNNLDNFAHQLNERISNFVSTYIITTGQA